MNERYYKLANEAWCSVNQRIGFNDAQRRELFEQKFAELIVKECIALVKPTSHHEVWAQSYLGGVDGLDLLHSKIKQIEEHFGVEE